MGWLSSIAIAQNPNSNPNAQAPWKLNGSQVDTTQFVGTINNVDLVFKRNNVESFRLLEDTAAKFFGDVYLNKFRIHPTPPPSSGPIQEEFLKVDNQGKIISTDKSGLLSAIYDEQLPCFLLPNNQLPVPIWSAIPGVLYTGLGCPASVGIGTDNPAASLDVRGTGYFSSFFGINTVPSNQYQLHVNSSVGTTAGIYLNTNHPQGWPNVKYGFQNVVNNSNTIAYAVTDLNSGFDVYRVMGDGHVWCTELDIKLKEDFPDYVFDNSYKLMSLAELEKYIIQHKHLPNTPTADQIREEGMSVGKMQVKQMEKIEELTLYLLEINKKLEKLEKENAELKKMILIK